MKQIIPLLLMTFSWTTLAKTSNVALCRPEPQPIANLRLEQKAADEFLADLKSRPDAKLNVEYFDFASQPAIYEIDLDNDGDPERLLVRLEKNRPPSIIVFATASKGGKWEVQPQIQVPVTSADLNFSRACNLNWLDTADGRWTLSKGQWIRSCDSGWRELVEQNIRSSLSQNQFENAWGQSELFLRFCQSELNDKDRQSLQKVLVAAAAEKGRWQLCGQIVREAHFEKSENDQWTQACLPQRRSYVAYREPTAPKPTPTPIPFPDISEVFISLDDDTDAIEEARAQRVKDKVIEATTPAVHLKSKSKKGPKSQSFEKWIRDFSVSDADFEIKAKRFVIWRAMANKSGEEQSLVWVDKQTKTSAVAVSLGLEDCRIGSNNLKPQALPAELVKELKDMCSEASQAIFYGADLKTTPILKQLQGK